jgi:hypothetical protein
MMYAVDYRVVWITCSTLTNGIRAHAALVKQF